MFQAINNMDRESSYAPTTSSYESSSLSDAVSSSRRGNGDPSQASTATIRGDSMKRAVRTDNAPPPLPFFSQAIVCQGMVYCSGSIGTSPITNQIVEGGVGDRTVRTSSLIPQQCLLTVHLPGPSAQQSGRRSPRSRLFSEERGQGQHLPI